MRFGTVNEIARMQQQRDAAERRPAGRPPQRLLASRVMVGRVVGKSCLSHWGGPHEKRAQSFATCFELTLADASGEMAVEVWN